MAAKINIGNQYERTDWHVGDIIGAEDLNHLEKRAAYNVVSQWNMPGKPNAHGTEASTEETDKNDFNELWVRTDPPNDATTAQKKAAWNNDTDPYQTFEVPEIDDDSINETDTWSSQHMAETFARNDIKNDDASSPITTFTEGQKDNIAYNSGTVRDRYLAPLFSASSSYKVGDYVMYNNKLYRCITAIETGGSWSTYSNRFTEVSMGNEVSGLKSDLELRSKFIFSHITSPEYFTWESGSFSADTGAPQTNAAFVRMTTPVFVTRGSTVSVSNFSTYHYQCMWYANEDCTGFNINNSKRSAIESVYTVPQDGYIKLSIRIVNQNSLTDLSIYKNFILNIYGKGQESISLNEKFNLLNIQATTKGYVKFDSSLFNWVEGVGLLGNNHDLALVSNRVAICDDCTIVEGQITVNKSSGYIACKSGSYIRILDKRFQVAVASYRGINGAAFKKYRTYSNEDWIATEDCIIHIAIKKVTNDTITSDEAKTAVEIVAFNEPNGMFEKGGIASNGTESDSATNRMRSNFLFLVKDTTLKIIQGTGYYVRRYTDNNVTSFIDFGGAHSRQNSVALNSNKIYTIPTTGYYRFVIATPTIYNININDIFNITSPKEHFISPAAYTLCAPYPTEPYIYSGLDIPSSSILGNTGSRYDTLINMYDTLMNNPNYSTYVTKTKIGEAPVSKNATKSIWAYEIDSKAYDTTRKPTPIPRETILWISNIHGSEYYCLMETYWLFKQLLETHNNNEYFATIWNNCKLVIVPALNPYGVDTDLLLKGRGNYNKVDCNRNFDADWTAGEEEEYWEEDGVKIHLNKGISPMDQPETKAVKTLLTLYPDPLFVVNRHDSSYISSAIHSAPYTSDTMLTDRRVLLDLAVRITPALRKKYKTWLTHYNAEFNFKRLVRTWENSVNTATMDKWLNMQGIHAALLESPRDNSNDEYRQNALQLGFDVSINLILTVLANAEFIRSSEEVTQVFYCSEKY